MIEFASILSYECKSIQSTSFISIHTHAVLTLNALSCVSCVGCRGPTSTLPAFLQQLCSSILAGNCLSFLLTINIIPDISLSIIISLPQFFVITGLRDGGNCIPLVFTVKMRELDSDLNSQENCLSRLCKILMCL